jgi:hypothetical protein
MREAVVDLNRLWDMVEIGESRALLNDGNQEILL